MTAHESAARARKALRLIEALESQRGSRDVPPLDMARALRSMPSGWWRGLARAADVRPPSQRTIDAVVESYERRAAVAAFGPAAEHWPAESSGKTTMLTEDPYPEGT